MTDNEIIRALKDEIKRANYIESYYIDCVDIGVFQNALDLINRLQAENERLSKITRPLIAEIKAEAYTEFAELLCKIWQSFENENICGISNQGLVKFVCKKMVGEDK